MESIVRDNTKVALIAIILGLIGTPIAAGIWLGYVFYERRHGA